jgi:hypothetical protein
MKKGYYGRCDSRWCLGAATRKELVRMAKNQFKCFLCGRIYDDEQAATKCHNSPVQKIVRQDMKRPRFLGG